MKKLLLPDSIIRKLHNSSNLHSVYSIPEFENSNNPSNTIKLHEVMQICEASDDGQIKEYSLGEVASIKECSLIDISKEDIANSGPLIKTKRDVLETLRKFYPEYRADIRARTPVKVITVRKFDYNLRTLNGMVKQKSG